MRRRKMKMGGGGNEGMVRMNEVKRREGRGGEQEKNESGRSGRRSDIHVEGGEKEKEEDRWKEGRRKE